jgi:hypothetical protein
MAAIHPLLKFELKNYPTFGLMVALMIALVRKKRPTKVARRQLAKSAAPD